MAVEEFGSNSLQDLSSDIDGPVSPYGSPGGVTSGKVSVGGGLNSSGPSSGAPAGLYGSTIGFGSVEAGNNVNTQASKVNETSTTEEIERPGTSWSGSTNTSESMIPPAVSVSNISDEMVRDGRVSQIGDYHPIDAIKATTNSVVDDDDISRVETIERTNTFLLDDSSAHEEPKNDFPNFEALADELLAERGGASVGGSSLEGVDEAQKAERVVALQSLERMSALPGLLDDKEMGDAFGKVGQMADDYILVGLDSPVTDDLGDFALCAENLANEANKFKLGDRDGSEAKFSPAGLYAHKTDPNRAVAVLRSKSGVCLPIALNRGGLTPERLAFNSVHDVDAASIVDYAKMEYFPSAVRNKSVISATPATVEGLSGRAFGDDITCSNLNLSGASKDDVSRVTEGVRLLDGMSPESAAKFVFKVVQTGSVPDVVNCFSVEASENKVGQASAPSGVTGVNLGYKPENLELRPISKELKDTCVGLLSQMYNTSERVPGAPNPVLQIASIFQELESHAVDSACERLSEFASRTSATFGVDLTKNVFDSLAKSSANYASVLFGVVLSASKSPKEMMAYVGAIGNTLSERSPTLVVALYTHYARYLDRLRANLNFVDSPEEEVVLTGIDFGDEAGIVRVPTGEVLDEKGARFDLEDVRLSQMFSREVISGENATKPWAWDVAEAIISSGNDSPRFVLARSLSVIQSRYQALFGKKEKTVAPEVKDATPEVKDATPEAREAAPEPEIPYVGVGTTVSSPEDLGDLDSMSDTTVDERETSKSEVSDEDLDDLTLQALNEMGSTEEEKVSEEDMGVLADIFTEKVTEIEELEEEKGEEKGDMGVLADIFTEKVTEIEELEEEKEEEEKVEEKEEEEKVEEKEAEWRQEYNNLMEEVPPTDENKLPMAFLSRVNDNGHVKCRPFYSKDVLQGVLPSLRDAEDRAPSYFRVSKVDGFDVYYPGFGSGENDPFGIATLTASSTDQFSSSCRVFRDSQVMFPAAAGLLEPLNNGFELELDENGEIDFGAFPKARVQVEEHSEGSSFDRSTTTQEEVSVSEVYKRPKMKPVAIVYRRVSGPDGGSQLVQVPCYSLFQIESKMFTQEPDFPLYGYLVRSSPDGIKRYVPITTHDVEILSAEDKGVIRSGASVIAQDGRSVSAVKLFNEPDLRRLGGKYTIMNLDPKRQYKSKDIEKMIFSGSAGGKNVFTPCMNAHDLQAKLHAASIGDGGILAYEVVHNMLPDGTVKDVYYPVRDVKEVGRLSRSVKMPSVLHSTNSHFATVTVFDRGRFVEVEHDRFAGVNNEAMFEYDFSAGLNPQSRNSYEEVLNAAVVDYISGKADKIPSNLEPYIGTVTLESAALERDRHDQAPTRTVVNFGKTSVVVESPEGNVSKSAPRPQTADPRSNDRVGVQQGIGIQKGSSRIGQSRRSRDPVGAVVNFRNTSVVVESPDIGFVEDDPRPQTAAPRPHERARGGVEHGLEQRPRNTDRKLDKASHAVSEVSQGRVGYWRQESPFGRVEQSSRSGLGEWGPSSRGSQPDREDARFARPRTSMGWSQSPSSRSKTKGGEDAPLTSILKDPNAPGKNNGEKRLKFDDNNVQVRLF